MSGKRQSYSGHSESLLTLSFLFLLRLCYWYCIRGGRARVYEKVDDYAIDKNNAHSIAMYFLLGGFTVTLSCCMGTD